MEGLISKHLQSVNTNKRENINDNGNEFNGDMIKKKKQQSESIHNGTGYEVLEL